MVFLLIGAFALPVATIVPSAHAQLNVPGEVIITGTTPPTCGLTMNPTTGFNYGSLVDQQVSTEQEVVLVNEGTADSDILIHGSDWADSTGILVMPVEATHYEFTPGTTYEGKIPLTYTSTPQMTLPANTGVSLYSQLKADLTNNPSFIGAAYQTITLNSQC